MERTESPPGSFAYSHRANRQTNTRCFERDHRAAMALDELSSIPLGIPRAGRGKGIAGACFSLVSRHPLAARNSQPPPPNKLSEGGWEFNGWRLISEKRTENDEGEVNRI